MTKSNVAKIKMSQFAMEPGKQIQEIDPQACSPWSLSNRMLPFVTPESCSDLIESIKENGQQIPALVRKKAETEEYELICGVRRLFACKFLGIRLRAFVADISDKDALLAMDAENRHREDISPYERACDYRQWLDSGIYGNYSEIIAAIGVKKSWFSQLIALADLPKEIIAAFGHPIHLKQKWGYALQVRCKKNKQMEAVMIQLAKELTGKSLSPVTVYKRLINVLSSEEQVGKMESILVTDSQDKDLFMVRYSNAGKPRLVFSRRLSDELMQKIIRAAKTLIEDHTP